MLKSYEREREGEEEKKNKTESRPKLQLLKGDQSEKRRDHCVKLALDCNDEIKNAIRVKTRSVSAIGQVQ